MVLYYPMALMLSIQTIESTRIKSPKLYKGRISHKTKERERSFAFGMSKEVLLLACLNRILTLLWLSSKNIFGTHKRQAP